MKPTTDPYRTLGILRGADAEQIKAAHRRLAKLFHPDGSTGDRRRFLDVQEAYQLLSDPLRRREWDRRHAPGPVRAGDGRRRADPSRRPSDGPRRGGDQAPPPSRPAPAGGPTTSPDCPARARKPQQRHADPHVDGRAGALVGGLPAGLGGRPGVPLGAPGERR